MSKLSTMSWDDIDQHVNLIIEDLNINHRPFILYEKDAIAFLQKHVKKYMNKSEKKIKKSLHGYFAYEGLPEEYSETGVVCVIKPNIGTLAHELCHAKQFESGSKWLQMGVFLKSMYWINYYFYPLEKEAFNYAEKFLKKMKYTNLANNYRRHKLKMIIQTIAKQFISTVIILLALLCFLTLFIIIKSKIV